MAQLAAQLQTVGRSNVGSFAFDACATRVDAMLVDLMNYRLACHMIEACDVAYAIGSADGIQSSPKYGAVGFHSEPEVIMRGPDETDACLVGSTDYGIIVAFRGTIPLTFEEPSKFFQSLLDWLIDAEMMQVEVPGIPGKVHKGFAQAVLDLWDPMTKAVQRQLGAGRNLFVTGHSKGASMASLAASRLLNLEGIRPSAVYPFAATRVGDPQFAYAHDQQLPQTWRFANRDDIVPHLPPSMELLEIMEALPGAIFKDLKVIPAYEHTKTLQFIKWDGTIVDFGKLDHWSALKLQAYRLEHLGEMLVRGQIEEILSDHACDGAYMTDTCSREK